MLKHLTLTVRNDPDLSKMTKHLLASFRKLRNTVIWKSGVVGGAFVIELTNKGNHWHAHLHIVIQAFWIEISDIMNAWYKCSDGNTGAYIRNIPPSEAVRYLSKYVTKSDLPEALQIEASEALKHYRLFSPFGSWYGINKRYEAPITRCSVCNEPSTFLPYDIIIGRWDWKPAITIDSSG